MLNTFKIFIKFRELPIEEIRDGARDFRDTYSEDISEDFIEEFVHFIQYMSSQENTELDIDTFLVWIEERELDGVFPNVIIALRIYKSMAVSNCSSERSFSCLKRIKTYLRSSMGNTRLNDLALLCIESEWAKSISYDEVIEIFCENKLRRRI